MTSFEFQQDVWRKTLFDIRRASCALLSRRSVYMRHVPHEVLLRKRFRRRPFCSARNFCAAYLHGSELMLMLMSACSCCIVVGNKERVSRRRPRWRMRQRTETTSRIQCKVQAITIEGETVLRPMHKWLWLGVDIRRKFFSIMYFKSWRYLLLRKLICMQATT